MYNYSVTGHAFLYVHSYFIALQLHSYHEFQRHYISYKLFKLNKLINTLIIKE